MDQHFFMLMTLWTQLQAKVDDRERGQGLVEYSLIIALVSILSVVALGLMSGAINDVFNAITAALAAAV